MQVHQSQSPELHPAVPLLQESGSPALPSVPAPPAESSAPLPAARRAPAGHKSLWTPSSWGLWGHGIVLLILPPLLQRGGTEALHWSAVLPRRSMAHREESLAPYSHSLLQACCSQHFADHRGIEIIMTLSDLLHLSAWLKTRCLTYCTCLPFCLL